MKAPDSWDIKVTSPEGTVLEISTGELPERLEDEKQDDQGYLCLLRFPDYVLWARPAFVTSTREVRP